MLRTLLKPSLLEASFMKNVRRSLSSDTIFALSSGQGKCGVAVVRVSGPQSRDALGSLSRLTEMPEPRKALLRSIRHPRTGEVLDKGLLLWFPAPKSFTGEDCLELHVHGGIAVVNSVLDALGCVPRLRLAEAGEFTRRAFDNGKLDLTEVEGIADLIHAETEFQRKQAFLQVDGSLSKLYNRWKGSLFRCVANLEAHIDFEETDTLEHGLIAGVCKDVERLIQELENHLSDGRRGEILRYGVRTIILGEPNVGKSSLFNVLCQRNAAIVTPIEGTTRDVLEATLNIEGYPVVMADTAGLRSETEDVIEREGILKAMQLYEISDLVLLVVDFQRYLRWSHIRKDKSFKAYLKEYVNSLNISTIYEKDRFTKPCVLILNKSDLIVDNMDFDTDNVVFMSCKTGDGVKCLLDNVAEHLKILCGEPNREHPSLSQSRHRQHLNDCIACLRLTLEDRLGGQCCDVVLMAEYLRKALRSLGKLVGTVTTEQLLDMIFKDFCIGK